MSRRRRKTSSSDSGRSTSAPQAKRFRPSATSSGEQKSPCGNIPNTNSTEQDDNLEDDDANNDDDLGDGNEECHSPQKEVDNLALANGQQPQSATSTMQGVAITASSSTGRPSRDDPDLLHNMDVLDRYPSLLQVHTAEERQYQLDKRLGDLERRQIYSLNARSQLESQFPSIPRDFIREIKHVKRNSFKTVYIFRWTKLFSSEVETMHYFMYDDDATIPRQSGTGYWGYTSRGSISNYWRNDGDIGVAIQPELILYCLVDALSRGLAAQIVYLQDPNHWQRDVIQGSTLWTPQSLGYPEALPQDPNLNTLTKQRWTNSKKKIREVLSVIRESTYMYIAEDCHGDTSYISFAAMDMNANQIYCRSFPVTAARFELETVLSDIQPQSVTIIGKITRSSRNVVEEFVSQDPFRYLEPDIQVPKDYITEGKEILDSLGMVMDPGESQALEQLTTKAGDDCVFPLAMLLDRRDLKHSVFEYSQLDLSNEPVTMQLDSNAQKYLLMHDNAGWYPADEDGPGKCVTGLFDVLTANKSTLTASTKRLLKTWMLHPLVSKEKIEERQGAVKTLIEEKRKFTGLFSVLENDKTHNHIESTFTKIRQGSSEPDSLRSILELLLKLSEECSKLQTQHELVGLISACVSDCAETELQLSKLLESVDRQAQSPLDYNTFFPVADPEGKARISADIDQQIADKKALISAICIYASTLLRYYKDHEEVNQIDYTFRLSKVRHDWYQTHRKFAEWTFTQVDQDTFEYWNEEINKLTLELAKLQEQQDIKEHPFRAFEELVVDHLVDLRRAWRSIVTLDCLSALSKTASANQWIKPIIDESPCVIARHACNPILARRIELRNKGKKATVRDKGLVYNDINLDGSDRCILIMTGANCAGKSTYGSMILYMVILAQIGSYVPATSATIGIFHNICTRMGAYDDVTQNRSQFEVALTELGILFQKAEQGQPVLFLCDELVEGAPTAKAVPTEHTALQYLANKPNAFGIFITHSHDLRATSDLYLQNGIREMHMESIFSTNQLQSTYKALERPSRGSYAFEVVEKAMKNSCQMPSQTAISHFRGARSHAASRALFPAVHKIVSGEKEELSLDDIEEHLSLARIIADD